MDRWEREDWIAVGAVVGTLLVFAAALSGGVWLILSALRGC